MVETKNNEMIYRTKKEILAAANYKGKTGRPKKITEKTTGRNIRIPDSDWEAMPETKSDFVREAIKTKLAKLK